MKILNTSVISNTSRFPFKKGTLQFLQDAHKEVIAALIKALIGSTYDPAVIYVMSGVLNSATLPTYLVSSGEIFYNGEVYDFDATSFTATGSNVGVFSVVQTNYTTDADPVTFTDATVRNVHNIRKMQLTQAASGSALADYSQAYFLSFRIPEQLDLTAPVTSPYVGNQLQIIGAYPNLILFVPPASNLNPALASGSVNFGDVPTGGADFAVTFGSTLSTADYIVMGSMVTNGTAEPDSTLIWTIKNRTTAGFTVHVREIGAFVQSVAWEWIAFAK